MRRFRHGLVIGKFYPPHLGHVALVRSAASACERVSVVVMAAAAEAIPLARRVQWLAETFAGVPHVAVTGVNDDLPVDYDSPEVWAAQVALMRVGLAQLGADRPAVGPPDAVFTAESYGEELARRFSAADVRLDRESVTLSGTSVREDLGRGWWDLPPATRAGLALRVVLVGAESTGKTTLALDLAQTLQARPGAWGATRVVREYGREWWATRVAVHRAQHPGAGWPEGFTAADFAHIAATQTAFEAEAAREGGPVLVCDTDAFATALWAERYLSALTAEVPPTVDHLPGRRLYLLLGTRGAPFVQDGWRDGEAIREAMDARFRELLTASGAEFVTIEGDWAERKAQALAVIEAAGRVEFSRPASAWGRLVPGRTS